MTKKLGKSPHKPHVKIDDGKHVKGDADGKHKVSRGKVRLPIADEEMEEKLDLNVSQASDVSESENEDENSEPESMSGKYDESDIEDEYLTGRRTFDVVDSSDEEDLRNTIGNVPVKWYEDEEHIGYDQDGKRVQKSEKPATQLDEFLARMEDPDYWKKVKDRQLGGEIALTDEQVATLKHIEGGKYPTVGYNPYEPWIDFFTYEVMKHPISDAPDHKRSFLPSKLDKQKVSKMVYAIKMGWLKPRPSKFARDKAKEEAEQQTFYDLWADQSDKKLSQSEMARLRMRMPAPKMALPGHTESYNPPGEYLWAQQEKAEWEAADEEERKSDFIPEKHDCLRHVPAYPRFVNDRFERCLDLYLAPRQQKMRLNVDPKDLLPQLPNPKDLQPFPNTLALIFRGHEGPIRSVRFEPKFGEYCASAGDDKMLRIWECTTGRCLAKYTLPGVCTQIDWCPSNIAPCLIAAACGEQLVLLNAGYGDKMMVSKTTSYIRQLAANLADENATDAKQAASWKAGETLDDSRLMTITFKHAVQRITWHHNGDYFATVSNNGGASSVIIHQLSKCRSQNPFTKLKGSVQTVAFDRVRPFFYVATKTHIRMYDLQQHRLIKKLLGNCRWISSIMTHPKGDNLIVGSHDCRLSWFDTDLSLKPYKTLKHHSRSVRSVAYHDHYPLFASASDDGKVIVCHGQVYNDLLQNALIVPVKVLGGHTNVDGLGVLDCRFHPKQPWIISAGADATLRLYTY